MVGPFANLSASWAAAFRLPTMDCEVTKTRKAPIALADRMKHGPLRLKDGRGVVFDSRLPSVANTRPTTAELTTLRFEMNRAHTYSQRNRTQPCYVHGIRFYHFRGKNASPVH